MTLLLNRSDLEGLLGPPGCLAALRQGFVAEPVDVPARRVVAAFPGHGSATALIPGLIDTIPAYTVKVNAKFPGSRPALTGVVCLHDLDSGELLALLDSATVTAWRTGLAAALGTDALARSDAEVVTVIGAGAQADLVLRGLAVLRRIGGLIVSDLDPGRAQEFARRHSAALGIQARVVAGAREAARDADIVIVATWARRPMLDAGDAGPGTHLTSLGADEPGKAELTAGLLRGARVVVDDLALAVEMGALGNVGLEVKDAAGTLRDVLRGDAPGRVKDDEITVYAPVGMPWQDLAVSWVAYRAALSRGSGVRYDFLG